MILLDALKAVAVVLNTLLVGPIVILVALFERDGKIGWRIALLWMRANLAFSGCRLTVIGREHLDPGASYVFMSNHRSNADIVALSIALEDFQLRWVAKRELLFVPIVGWALLAMGNIIIDRRNRERAIASYARARRRMERGISVLVFPEATRGRGVHLLPFKKGGFVFALETGRPIVPIAIRGTERALPKGRWRLRPAAVELQIGLPIDVRAHAVDQKERLMARVRHDIETMLGAGRELPAPERAARGAAGSA